MKEKFSKISEKALTILLQFLTSYLYELGFSTLTNIKTKKREKLLGVEEEIRVALLSIRHRIRLITKIKQSQISHYIFKSIIYYYQKIKLNKNEFFCFLLLYYYSVPSKCMVIRNVL